MHVGQKLGPYEIVGEIGEGGMGAVYRAHDPRLGRTVAIKVLREDVTGDRDRRQRFIQEAKAASALSHPNIITVFDIGTEGEVVYLVMELVAGRSLDTAIPAGGFSAVDVLRIGSQIADACATAHAHQIIHRDLKPANVMLQADGRVKVLDFGLAKIIEMTDATRSVTQTSAGTVLGTAAYMSPEQAEGKPLDARTDIFSLGAVLYELATGQRAFAGDSQASVLAEVLKTDPPPPDTVRADMPADLARVILRCLRKDPARRVQSMADLRASLDEIKDDMARGTTSTAGPHPRPPAAGGSGPVAQTAGARRGSWAAFAYAAVAVVLAVGGYFVWRSLNTASAPDAASQAYQGVPFTTFAGSEYAGGFSPDGTQLVFSWDGESETNRDIYVKVVGPGSPLRLTTDPARDLIPRWAPDGRQIAFARLSANNVMSVILIPPLGGPERKLVEFYPRVAIVPLFNIAWTPDSRYLLVAAGRSPGDASDVHRVSVDTGDVKTIITAGSSSDGYLGLDVSPDRRRLAAVRDHLGSQEIELFDLSPEWEASRPRNPLATAVNALDARWTADSRDLIFTLSANNPLPLYRVSIESGKTEPLLWAGPGATSPILSIASHRLVFTREVRDTNIWRVPLAPDGTRSGGAPDKIAVSSFREVAPDYSPDGKRLAFHSNRSGSVQIWVADADGSNAVQLTSLDPMATTGTPRWSPDSRSLVFDSNAEIDAGNGTKAGYRLFVVSASGGQPRPITPGGTQNFVAAWSPDAAWIYFTSTRTGRPEIWRTRPDGADAQQVTRTGATSPLISPDGRWLYFAKGDGIDGIWRMPIAGGGETRVVDRVFRYNYAVTARGVYYAEGSMVRFLNLATKKTTDIVSIDTPIDLGLAVSPDGRHLLFTKKDHTAADLVLVEGFR